MDNRTPYIDIFAFVTPPHPDWDAGGFSAIGNIEAVEDRTFSGVTRQVRRMLRELRVLADGRRVESLHYGYVEGTTL